MAQFPLRAGHRCRWLRDATQFVPAMLQAIDAATHSVCLEMYLMQSGALADRLFDKLCAAALRGLNVYCLLDDFGCLGLNSSDRSRLRKAGVKLAWYNPLSPLKLSLNLFRDHRKLLLIDGQYAFVGGTGVTDQFIDKSLPWRDNMLYFEGPCSVDLWRLFSENWSRWADEKLVMPPLANTSVGPSMLRLVGSHYGSLWFVRRAASGLIRAAQRRIWLASPYFLPPWDLRWSLQDAAQRGVDVRLLVPGSYTDHPTVRIASHRLYGWMLAQGVRIFEYQPRFLHSKVLVCDDVATVGSCNFDRYSLRWNLEMNVEIHDAGLTAKIVDDLVLDLTQSQEITLSAWRNRSLWARLAETVASWIEARLVRRSYRSRVRLESWRRRK